MPELEATRRSQVRSFTSPRGDAHGPTHVAAIRSCSLVRRCSSFARSGRHRETGHRRVEPLSRLPLGRAGTVAGTNPTDKTNTNGYPYPSCVPIVDGEEPVISWERPREARDSGGRSQGHVG